MKCSEAKMGRVFVVRLEQDEILHEVIEKFALDRKIKAAACIALGAADKGSRFVVGPEDGDARPVVPMEHLLREAHEISGTGTIFPDEEGRPILHMHLATGRQGSTITGCVRRGVKVWQIAEVVIFELLETDAVRRMEPQAGFVVLEP
ncbi:MAG: PPC domain-containing DNA-binding protein [Syntrophaceae bacterium]